MMAAARGIPFARTRSFLLLLVVGCGGDAVPSGQDAGDADPGYDADGTRDDGGPDGSGGESLCADGIDNDGDGLTDCWDRGDCDGRACDDWGEHMCRAGRCVCSSGSFETWCADGVDNDCDGLADCADPSCTGELCGPLGLRCSHNTCVCPYGDVETDCVYGSDDDCDGLTDCGDPDCAGRSCDDTGRVCLDGVCSCLGGPTETGCSGGLDDDCDTFTDCEDDDCFADSGCASASPEVVCRDAVDSDGDGLTDCADPDCDARPCDLLGRRCAGDICACPGGATEDDCANWVDDDCDGLTDCEEPGCDGEVCPGGAPGDSVCFEGSCCWRRPPCTDEGGACMCGMHDDGCGGPLHWCGNCAPGVECYMGCMCGGP
jgi:hypothetical protein